jgi:O-antigen/teichoic acid export membrane protein
MINKLKSYYQNGAANRAAINTIIVYVQRGFAALLSLVTTPIILRELGIESYGIYTLTIGFVGMISFVNWSLSSATQRFVAFAFGKQDKNEVKEVFSTIFGIHIFYALLMFFTLLGVAFLFFEDILNIPTESIQEAKHLFFIVSLLTFFNIMNTPFLGVLRANENFFEISLIGIFQSVTKLGVALVLIILTTNKLVTFGLLILAIEVLSFFVYFLAVKRRCSFIDVTTNYFSRSRFREILSFMSWSILGALAIVSRNQGVQVILNIFFGVVKNAAYGITMQVNAALSIFSQGVLSSLSPQIIKAAGAGDTVKMMFLMKNMSKFALISISIFSVPLFFYCQFILELWLENLPDDTVVFTRLIILLGQVMLLSAGIQTVFNASGKVKKYNIWVSLILILNLPIAYLFFKWGFPSYSILVIGLVLEFISFIVRYMLLREYIKLSIFRMLYETIIEVVLPLALLYVMVFLSTLLTDTDMINLLISFFASIIIFPILFYSFFLRKEEKIILNRLIPYKKSL